MHFFFWSLLFVCSIIKFFQFLISVLSKPPTPSLVSSFSLVAAWSGVLVTCLFWLMSFLTCCFSLPIHHLHCGSRPAWFSEAVRILRVEKVSVLLSEGWLYRGPRRKALCTPGLLDVMILASSLRGREYLAHSCPPIHGSLRAPRDL